MHETSSPRLLRKYYPIYCKSVFFFKVQLTYTSKRYSTECNCNGKELTVNSGKEKPAFMARVRWQFWHLALDHIWYGFAAIFPTSATVEISDWLNSLNIHKRPVLLYQSKRLCSVSDHIWKQQSWPGIVRLERREQNGNLMEIILMTNFIAVLANLVYWCYNLLKVDGFYDDKLFNKDFIFK